MVGDIEAGYQFGHLGLKLLAQQENARNFHRIWHPSGGGVLTSLALAAIGAEDRKALVGVEDIGLQVIDNLRLAVLHGAG